MSAFVVLALALAVMSAGAAIVVASQLLRRVRTLGTVTQRVSARLRPLLDELQAETAVVALEGERLQSRLSELREQREGHAHARSGRRKQRAALRGRQPGG